MSLGSDILGIERTEVDLALGWADLASADNHCEGPQLDDGTVSMDFDRKE